MNEWILGDARYAPPRSRPQPVGGFWRRQFEGAPTRAQRRFDVMFGIVMPIVCFYFDPVVFRGGFIGGGLYSRFQLYAYMISALEMVALCAWLFALRSTGRRPAALAGMLFAGGLFSLIVGLALLPYSCVGLLFLLIGALGFVPFMTAFVYLRNGWRAAGAVGRAGGGWPGLAVAALLCGFVFALGLPAVVQRSVRNEVKEALGYIREGKELSPARLKTLRAAAAVSGLAMYDEIVWAYHKERDPARRAWLAKAYAEITAGGDIERRLRILSD